MKIVKRLLSIFLCITFAATCWMGVASISRQNYSGRQSSITTISAENKEWIIDKFGNCSDIECLIRCVEDYAVRNFQYDYDKSPFEIYIQSHDFDEIIRTGFGICSDFSFFVKNVCLCWSELKQVPLKVFAVDVKYEGQIFKSGHSYNIIQMPDGRNYYCDITGSIYRVQIEGIEPIGFETFYESIEDYTKRYNEVLMALH